MTDTCTVGKGKGVHSPSTGGWLFFDAAPKGGGGSASRRAVDRKPCPQTGRTLRARGLGLPPPPCWSPSHHYGSLEKTGSPSPASFSTLRCVSLCHKRVGFYIITARLSREARPVSTRHSFLRQTPVLTVSGSCLEAWVLLLETRGLLFSSQRRAHVLHC